MEPKTIALSAAFIAAIGAVDVGARLIAKPDMETIAKEVDAYRAAQSKVAEEVGLYLPTAPTEIEKALQAAGLQGKRLRAIDSCKTVGGRVICQLEEGREVQFPPALTAKLAPEVAQLADEQEAAIQAKAEELAAEKVSP